MPTYTYHCTANDRSLDVRHSFAEMLTTWGEVTLRAGQNPSPETPLDAPVKRLMTGGMLLTARRVSGGGDCCGDPNCGGHSG